MGRTYEALLRAQKKFQKNLNQKKLPENIEPLFTNLGLGEAQILNQSYSQLKHSLDRLNGFIIKPESFHKLYLENGAASEMGIKRSILRVLFERKELVLGCIDMLFTNKKNEEIRKLVNEIPNKKVRSALIRNLNDLEVLNKFLIKEYVKILQRKNV
ncbi:MAG: hypothetical protein V2I56_11045 [Desulfobacteraceae bacterium]|jgi:hypothetical protein|nr:hypothetical protein [Desulfobacteraceae bacterium]